VARACAKIADQRLDGLHKLSTRLIRENQTVCVETLAVKPLVRQSEYKATWYGRTLVKIDKWYPSAKRCSICGHVLNSLPLAVRQWICSACGVSHDRDITAAKNVLAAGRAVNACGEAIRPGRAMPATARPNEAGIPQRRPWGVVNCGLLTQSGRVFALL
jgi:putative transposase